MTYIVVFSLTLRNQNFLSQGREKKRIGNRKKKELKEIIIALCEHGVSYGFNSPL
jgi:hypothetical protein